LKYAFQLAVYFSLPPITGMVELSQNWLVRAVGLKIELVDVLKRELLSAILITLKEDDQSSQMQFSQISITKT